MVAFDVSGQVAMVTGAGRGIGRAIALGLAEAGADVVLVSRTSAQLEQVADEVRKLGRRAYPLPGDISVVAEARRIAAEAERVTNGVGILVNCAGSIVRVSALEVEEAAWEQMFGANVKGAFFLSQAIGASMLKRKSGSIVNITSVAAVVKTRAPSVYGATKAALVQITRSLAAEWAPSVRVNAVGPAYIETDLNREWLAMPENARYVLSNTPLERVGTPADVVAAVVFLASPASAYITGQHLLVDGGWTTR